jgi:hypothetical protein
VAVPIAWPFETDGSVLSPEGKLVPCPAATAPPAGVPTLSELARGLTEGPGHGDGDQPVGSDLQAALPDEQTPDFSALETVGDGDGPAVVLVGDPVNFADGAITRRVSFPAKALPVPVLALAFDDARKAHVADGQTVEVSSCGASLTAQVQVEEHQVAGQAALYGAYAESQRLVAAACGDGPVAPVRVSLRRT